MKLKKILSDMKEEFYKGAESSVDIGEYREIFKNPTQQELNSLEEETGRYTVRFVAVKEEQNVYVASIDVFHEDIAYKIGIKGIREALDNFAGIGEIYEGNVDVYGLSDNYMDYSDKKEQLYKDIGEGKYDWLEEKENFRIGEIRREAEKELRFL